MTVDEFIAELADTKEYGWRISKMPEDSFDDWVVGKAPGDEYDVCPVTAVCHKKTGKWHNINGYKSAGGEIGLQPAAIHAIVGSADNDPGRGLVVELRNRILEACGLKEKANG